jgi:NAD(P)H dehydrogenase (quinone)
LGDFACRNWPLDVVRVLASSEPHIAQHLKTLTRLVAGGRYYDDLVSEDLANLLGRPPKTLRWALEHNPIVQDQIRAVRT